MDLFVLNILVIMGILVIPAYSTIRLQVTYGKYKKENNKGKLTGYDVAKKILDNNNLTSIYIVSTQGNLTDHYDSDRKTLRLSKDIYEGTSIAALAVAAHECGHAVQDAKSYKWFKVRHNIYPAVSLGEKVAMVVLIIGLVLGSLNFLYAAIGLMGFALVFEIVTLPVELDASKRALAMVEDYNISTDKKELKGVKKVLNAAAFTYIAAIISTVGEMLYYVLRANNRR